MTVQVAARPANIKKILSVGGILSVDAILSVGGILSVDAILSVGGILSGIQ